jgi:hypothetical protein|tara:strand:+ start:1756 stop:2418 length:663 start_codon:yes stop_codon:yes gene_type:complete
MHKTVKNIIQINTEIQKKIEMLNYNRYFPNIIAVSKTFPMDEIKPLIDHGHIHFGENKVQEAIEKWQEEIQNNTKIKLHMVGKLQRNKVKLAVQLFHYIHSVDNLKLAQKIAEEQKKQNKQIKVFLQINIGKEEQKSGIPLEEVQNLYNDCLKLDLNVIGLMCLPPLDNKASTYFKNIKNMNNNLSMNELSIGMSNNYLEAVEFKTTFLRIGTKIFGARD